jgi:hypothetical protein
LQKTEVLSSPLSTFRDVHGDLALNLPAALNLVAPLDRQTLGERAYAKLADLLISGRLAPGEKLSLRAAADVLGVSIMPVRAAVSRLVADKALEVTPNRAVRVPLMSAAQFRDLTKVRIAIEGHAAAQAGPRLDRARGSGDAGGKRAGRARFAACGRAQQEFSLRGL